jgi:hypothetical protein
MHPSRTACVAFLLAALAAPAAGQQPDPVKAAQAFRTAKQPVAPVSDTTVIAEAEEFQPQDKGGWQAHAWGENYFCATFANSFLSRKAFLGAPEQCERSTAVITVEVPKAGKYLALVRYESCYRFETQFRLQIVQNGKQVLDRLYGARDNVKIWAFREKLKKEVAWSWGAGENVVWEGHDAFVELQPGAATLTLVADKQPTPAARRNVDLVMLTSDAAEVAKRIDKENYLPLDGLLTQAGDVYMKLHNHPGGSPMTLTVPNGTEHSPYWVHLRTWKPRTLTAEPGKSTDWTEVGGLLDTLNDGQWTLTVKGKGALHYHLEFGVKNAKGAVETIARFDDLKEASITLAYDADTRYTRRIRRVEDVLYELVAYLKKHPVEGVAPKRTLIYGYTFTAKPGDAKYTAALEEFRKLMGATALGRDTVEDAEGGGLVRGYIDVRGVPTAKLEEYCKRLVAEGRGEKIAVVSLGDEIGLAAPPAKDHTDFRTWLQGQNLKPADVDPKAAAWEQVNYSATPQTAKDNPRLYYYSKIYGYRHGIANLKERTDILRRHFPKAGVGANFSPHHGSMYLGPTHMWIGLFREGGMTMPWGEDYIWQVPVGTQQMNFLMLDMFRAGIKDKKDAKIHYYVMAHTPGNTTASWRRQWYGDLAHGAKVLNLFEFRPVQAAYTENHVSDPAMYQEVRKSIHELGKFEDIIQDGRVRPAEVGLWFSEAADVWGDLRPPFDAAKRCLYATLRRLQMPLDCVVDGDDLKPYKVLYVTDAHVSRAGTAQIAQWVNGGGTLIATAGAGLYDEFHQPNEAFAALLGLADRTLLEHQGEPIRFEKQDLPFAQPVDTVVLGKAGAKVEVVKCGVYGQRSRAVLKGAEVLYPFLGGTPALTRHVRGKGAAYYFAFLPGLSFFKPALPLRPVDRGASDDTLAHFLPTEFDLHMGGVVFSAGLSTPPVYCTADVETTMIEAPQGVVIPLVNWGPKPLRKMRLLVSIPVPTKTVALASGRPVQVERHDDATLFTLDLDVADALILRK